jgi:hypothetical protein
MLIAIRRPNKTHALMLQGARFYRDQVLDFLQLIATFVTLPCGSVIA